MHKLQNENLTSVFSHYMLQDCHFNAMPFLFGQSEFIVFFNTTVELLRCISLIITPPLGTLKNGLFNEVI